MFETSFAFINQWIGPIGTIVGLFTAIPIFWTWYSVVFGRKRQHRKWHEEASNIIGKRPSVLVVDLLPNKEIRSQVRHFMAGDEHLKSIPDDRIFMIERSDRLTPAAMPEIYREIVARAADVARAGTDVLHVFLAGPVSAAAIVGAEFANAGCQVNLYQNEQGNYKNYGPLRHWT
jgi:hypothetical protein